MKFLLPAVFVAFWSIYIWLADPFHIEDLYTTDIESFYLWGIGALVAGFLGLSIAVLWSR